MPEGYAEYNYAGFDVVKDLTKASYGRPFFKCSRGYNGCNYFEWGDETIIPKPVCRHGKPCRLQKVKKEGSNQGREFFCCPEPKENSCKFFKWYKDDSEDLLDTLFQGLANSRGETRSVQECNTCEGPVCKKRK